MIVLGGLGLMDKSGLCCLPVEGENDEALEDPDQALK